MDVSTVSGFLASIVAGGGTFLIAKWFLSNWPKWVDLSRQWRFFSVYALSFGLAGGAYGLQVWLAYVLFSVDSLFAVCVTAFATSQALWGIFEAGKSTGPKAIKTEG